MAKPPRQPVNEEIQENPAKDAELTELDKELKAKAQLDFSLEDEESDINRFSDQNLQAQAQQAQLQQAQALLAALQNTQSLPQSQPLQAAPLSEVQQVAQSNVNALSLLPQQIQDIFLGLVNQVNTLQAQVSNVANQQKLSLPKAPPLVNVMDETPKTVRVKSTGRYRHGSVTYDFTRAGQVLQIPAYFARLLEKNQVVESYDDSYDLI